MGSQPYIIGSYPRRSELGIPLLQSPIWQMGSLVGDCPLKQLLTFTELDLINLELNQRLRISPLGHLSMHTISSDLTL